MDDTQVAAMVGLLVALAVYIFIRWRAARRRKRAQEFLQRELERWRDRGRIG